MTEVGELESTHAPLLAIAYFMNEYCREYSDDFMQCKRENAGNPSKCALEGLRILLGISGLAL